MTFHDRHRGDLRTVTLAVACTLAMLMPIAAAASEGIGVVLAPANAELSAVEAEYAEMLVGALVARSLSATVLHVNSPLVRAADLKLPAVSATDDWTPLSPVLDRIATQLRLDHVLLTAIDPPAGEAGRITGLLVARGGESARISANDAETMAREVERSIAPLGPPHDTEDQVVPIGTEVVRPRVDEPVAAEEPAEVEELPAEPVATEDERALAEPVEAEVERPAPSEEVGDRPTPPVAVEEPPTPVAVIDEPQLPAPADETEAPKPVDPALAPAEEAYEKGKLDEATELLGDYLQRHGPSGRTHFLRARLSLARLQHEDAINQLQQAVAFEPELVEPRVWLARLLAERGLWQKSIDHYEKALEHEPTNLAALMGLARTYRDHGHRRKAIALLQEADNAARNDLALLMMLADLHVAEGNVELAARSLLRAATFAGGAQRAAALERLGDIYVELGRHRDALGCYLEAAELSPSRTSMAKRRYQEVMAAADGAVHEALTAGWSIFENYVEDSIGQRETVFRHLSDLNAQLDEALRFADGITPPAELRVEHGRRQLAYSLAIEGTVSALSYLDLGENAMLERAVSRHGEALGEFRLLQQSNAY